MKRLVIALTLAAVSMIAAGTVAAQAPQAGSTALSQFTITVAKTSPDGVSLTCEKGCSWKTLAFRLTQTPTPIDANGMRMDEALSPQNADGFLIRIGTDSKGMALSCDKGCAWKTLGFSVRGTPTPIDQMGMVEPPGRPAGDSAASEPAPLRQGAPGLTLPRLLKEARPAYTREAMDAKIQGTVALECIVKTDGQVGTCTVTRSLDATHGLDQEAISAAQKWRFEPGKKDGKPVPVLVTIELTFTLRK